MRKIAVLIVLALASVPAALVKAAAPQASRIPAWLGVARHPLLEAMYLVAEHRPAEALPYLEISFKNGNTVAPYWMAKLLAAGAQGKSGKSLAPPWAAMAAVGGNPRGLLEIGLLYEKGIGVRKSSDLAGYFFALAALKNVRGALWRIRGLAKNGGLTVAGRRRILRKFHANAGTPVGKWCMAYLYNAGVLVPKNPRRFRLLMRAAAAGGDSHAIMAEDVLQNYFPKGAWKHPERAFQATRRAAHAGSLSAMMWLEGFYRTGFGVGKSRKRAHYWLQQRAKNGDPEAMTQMANRFLNLPPMAHPAAPSGTNHRRFSLAAAARWALRAQAADVPGVTTINWGQNTLSLVLKMHHALVAGRPGGHAHGN